MLDTPFLQRLHAPQRYVVAAAAALAAAAHIPVIAPHLDEAPYMGVLFVVLTVACLTLGAAALAYDCPVVYIAAAVTCGLAILGYSATRLVAFPMLAHDVGHWLDPLGVLSIATETVVVIASARALLRRKVRDRGLANRAATTSTLH